MRNKWGNKSPIMHAVRKHGINKNRFLKDRKFICIDCNGVKRNGATMPKPVKGIRKMVIALPDVYRSKTAWKKGAGTGEQYRTIVESMEDLVFMMDRDCRFILVNGKVLESLSAPENQVVGKRYHDFYDSSDSKVFSGHLAKVFESGKSFRYEHKNKKDSRYALRTISPLLHGGSGKVQYVVVVSRDITDLKETEEKLKFLSLHDSLTGLYNRAYFEEEMRRFDTDRFEGVGIIVCDIDGLKLINDTLGHDKGDELLVAASKVIRRSFRGSDVVARVGGDEFAILLPESSQSKLEYICRRIKNTLSQHNEKKNVLPLSISVGFAIRNSPGQEMAKLYREADNNMYKEKLYGSQSARNLIVKSLIDVAEAKRSTGHSSLEGFQELVIALGRGSGMPEEKIKNLRLLVQYHDIGNISIQKKVLSKAGNLSGDEITEMRKHCDVGHRIAQSAPDLTHISDFILKHHEWWNGKGYPLGLKGHDIPIESRIIAIVDAYQAMVSSRPYRTAMGKREALEELKNCSGIQFDPELVDCFIDIAGDS